MWYLPPKNVLVYCSRWSTSKWTVWGQGLKNTIVGAQDRTIRAAKGKGTWKRGHPEKLNLGWYKPHLSGIWYVPDPVTPSNNPRNDFPFLINAETKAQRGSSISFSITFFYCCPLKNFTIISCQNNSIVSKFISLVLTVLPAYPSWSILNTNWVILPDHVTTLLCLCPIRTEAITYIGPTGWAHWCPAPLWLILHHSPCGLTKSQLHWPPYPSSPQHGHHIAAPGPFELTVPSAWNSLLSNIHSMPHHLCFYSNATLP